MLTFFPSLIHLSISKGPKRLMFIIRQSVFIFLGPFPYPLICMPLISISMSDIDLLQFLSAGFFYPTVWLFVTLKWWSTWRTTKFLVCIALSSSTLCSYHWDPTFLHMQPAPSFLPSCFLGDHLSINVEQKERNNGGKERDRARGNYSLWLPQKAMCLWKSNNHKTSGWCQPLIWGRGQRDRYYVPFILSQTVSDLYDKNLTRFWREA